MILKLKKRLSEGALPGVLAQQRLKPLGRLMHSVPPHDYVNASVLILFLPDGQVPLIKRVEDGFVHGGQIALPGGAWEKNESAEQAALREANEEVGLDIDTVEILGRLTPLSIPVSRYLVYPIVGYCRQQANFIPAGQEVDEIILMDLSSLEQVYRQQDESDRLPFGAPYFLCQGHKVWGATAMILSELNCLMKELPKQ